MKKPTIQIINRPISDIAEELDLLAGIHGKTEISLTEEDGTEIATSTYALVRQALIRSQLMELTPKGYGMLHTKEGAKIVTEASYFENLKTEQKKRVTDKIHAAIEKYMSENKLKVPDALIVSEKIYDCLEKVPVLITGLYSIAVELEKALAASEFKLRPHIEDAEEV